MRQYLRNPSDSAATELVGEMILLAIVVLVVGVFAANLSSFIPSPRDPSVTILTEKTGNTFSLYHKGGDPVHCNELRIYVNDKQYPFQVSPESNTFLLGSSLIIRDVSGSERIKLVTSRKVLFQGTVP